MNSSGILLFGILNLILLVLTLGLLVVFVHLGNRRKDVFSRLTQSLDRLGFTKRGWTRHTPAILFMGTDGYYSSTVDGKPLEVHFYAVGGRKFKFTPYVEFALLGYFNAQLAIFTPDWHLSSITRMLPQKLSLPGYEGLEIRTADENSARLLLENENVCQMVRKTLSGEATGLLTISPRDIHLTFRIDNPDAISDHEIQSWVRSMVRIAAIVAALPPLDPEVIYNSLAQSQSQPPRIKAIVLLILLLLIGLPIIIVALFLKH